MIRYFAEISYRGTAFHGYQIQPNALSVQQAVEEALSLACRTTVADTVGSGRTDTGVHALQQYIHFEVPDWLGVEEDLDRLRLRLNGLLKPHIVIHRIFPVPEEAHARFSATARRYHYLIARTPLPHADGLAMVYYPNVKLPLLQTAAHMLLEHQDFQCFSRSRTDVKHYNCQITKAEWAMTEPWLVFEIEADRFLRGMVRAIVGTLLDVGAGKISLGDLREILNGKDRRLAGQAAPPQGLYLSGVSYPAHLVTPAAIDPIRRLFPMAV